MSISVNNNKITDLATPTNANDAVNKAYVDGKVPSGRVITLSHLASIPLTKSATSQNVQFSNLASASGVYIELTIMSNTGTGRYNLILGANSNNAIAQIDGPRTGSFQFMLPFSHLNIAAPTGATIVGLEYEVIENGILTVKWDAAITADSLTGNLVVYKYSL